MDTGLRLETWPDLDAAREAWRPLAERVGNPFASWEWVSTWWRHFGRGRSLQATACRRRDGSVAAILPLCAESIGPLRVLRFLGHGVGDHLGPICAPEDRPAAASALREVLATSGCRILLAERLPAEEGWRGRLGGAVVKRDSSPTLRIGGMSWDDYLNARSANFRSQVRRRERKLAREHQLRFRLADDLKRLDDDFGTFLALHGARWGEAESRAFRGERADFHRDFAARALERGWLRLVFLELDDRPVAAWYGLRFGQADWYYQAGRDPAWRDGHVGSVLLAHTVRQAFEDGMREYRFLRGGEGYKCRFTEDDPGLETLVAGRGVGGRLAVLGAERASSLPAPARRAVTRALGS